MFLRDDGDAAERLELGRDLGARRSATTLTTPGTFERRGVVEARDLAAEDRRPRDHGVEHAVEPRVDAVDRRAGGDVAVVDQADLVLADVAEARSGSLSRTLSRAGTGSSAAAAASSP